MNNQQPTSGWVTSEFALTLMKMIVGVLVMGGIVAPQHQDDFIKACTTIIGGVIALAPALAYIWSRTYLKAKAGQTPPPAAVNNPSGI